MITNAVLASQIARLTRLASNGNAYLAAGMWNPHFCSADASDYAMSFCEDVRQIIDWIEKVSAEAAMPTPSPD